MDVCELIVADHIQQRSLFAQIEEIPVDNVAQLEMIWGRLHALLDTHAAAEERLFYPAVLKVGRGAGGMASAQAETEDAIKDHNEIRDAASAVSTHPVASEAWFDAVDHCNKVNSEHISEEEREGLTDVRRHAALTLRHELGVSFAAFDATNLDGVAPVDKDPAFYVHEVDKSASALEAPHRSSGEPR